MSKKQTDKNTEPLLTFPCDFPIKIFGKADSTFEATALSTIRRFVPDTEKTNITARSSEHGKYIALSITVHVDSREQLDSIYQALTSSPDIIMVL